MVPKIVVTDANFSRLDQERAVAARYGAQFVEACCASAQDVMTAATGANVLLVQFAQITAQVIEGLAPNAVIVRYGLGLDNIDLAAAQRKHVRVAYVPDYATGEVADHTATLILAALRKIARLNSSVRAGLWDPVGIAKPIQSFSSSAVGFIGFGRIGREVHERLKRFGFTSLVADPFVGAGVLNSVGAQAADLDALFEMSDVITLHAPLTNETRHIVNAGRLAAMKSTAVIVNTARGGLIDSAALEQALLAGRIGGAALDVFEQEPLPSTSALRDLPNVILTPHIAWYSMQSIERLQHFAADEVDRALSGRPARCPAPLERL